MGVQALQHAGAGVGGVGGPGGAQGLVDGGAVLVVPEVGEAGVWAALAQAVLERMDGVAGPLQAGLWASLGSLRVHEGRYAEARELLTQALELYRAVLDPLAPRIAQTHSDLGNALRNLGALDEAIGHYEAARAIREQTLGAAHPQVAMVLNNLAVVHATRGDLVRAEPLYRQAIAVWEAALGPEHPSLGHALTNLGSLLEQRGEHEPARLLATRALAVWEQAYGPEHPDLLSPLLTLGNIQKAEHDFAAAEQTYRRTLALSETALGPEHPDLGYTLSNLGDLALQQGRLVEARRASERAVALFERAGTAEEIVAEARLVLVGVELAERRHTAAAALAERVIPQLQGNVPARGNAHLLLAQALWASGERPRARQAATAALADFQSAAKPEAITEAAAWLRAHR